MLKIVNQLINEFNGNYENLETTMLGGRMSDSCHERLHESSFQ